MSLPNFFVVGAARAGTTSIYQYLLHHPQVFVCPIKEPCYFSKDIDLEQLYPGQRYPNLKKYLSGRSMPPVHQAYVTEWDDYLALFRSSNSAAAIGECSVTYLPSVCAAGEIRRAAPDAKIVIMLRDPVERAFSDYLMHFNQGWMRHSFLEEIRDALKSNSPWTLVNRSLYYTQVKRYLETFHRNAVRIFLNEDLADLAGFQARLYEFLGVDGSFRPPVKARHNESTTPRLRGLKRILERSGLQPFLGRVLKSPLGPFSRRMMYRQQANYLEPSDRCTAADFFASDVRRLQDLICRDLSTWLAA